MTKPSRFAAIVDSAYLARGLVMIESLHERSPGVPVDIVCMDAEARTVLQDLGLEGICAIDIADLERFDPDLARVRGERTLAEYCWTAKPSLCQYLFERYPDVDTIVYADADLMFFTDPEPVVAQVHAASALVIPHRAPPGEDWEQSRGMYNAGFIAFRRSSDAFAILAWWRERCLEWCFDRVEPGRFCDQKYLDEWPCRFAGVRVLDNIGGGLAPWNASAHRITMRAGSVWIDDVVQLVFFHYQSLQVYRGLVAVLVRLRLFSSRFRSVAGDGFLSWSVWASYQVADDAERYVYAPYVRKLAAASRRAALRRSGELTYRRLSARVVALELARGILGPARRAFLARSAGGTPNVPGSPAVNDEPPKHA